MSGKKRRSHKIREKTILDTNVLFAGIGKGSKESLGAIHKATHRDKHVYTKTIDDELSRFEGDPKVKKKIDTYRKNHKKKMIHVKHSSDDDLKKLPAKGNDKYILDDALKTNSKKIITMDKKFMRKANGYKGIELLSPNQYTKSNNKNNMKKGKKGIK